MMKHSWKSCCRQKRHEGSNPSHCARTEQAIFRLLRFLQKQERIAAVLSAPCVTKADFFDETPRIMSQ